MKYIDMLKDMNLEELKEFVAALQSNPNIVKDVYNDELAKQQKEQEAKQEEQKKLIEEVTIKKENAERLIGSPELFLSKCFEILKGSLALSNNENLNRKVRLNTRMATIFAESILLNSFYDLKNIIHMKYADDFYEIRSYMENEFYPKDLDDEFYKDDYEPEVLDAYKTLESPLCKTIDSISNNYLGILNDEYKVISYQYGKERGLPDEDVINRTTLSSYGMNSVMTYIWNYAINLEQFLGSYFDVNKGLDWIVILEEDHYKDLPSEYTDWMSKYTKPENAVELLKRIATFLSSYYKVMGFNPKDKTKDYVIEGPDDYQPDGERIKIYARSNKEKEELVDMLSPLQKENVK